MIYIINESQFNKIIEAVVDGDVICDNCGWSWELSAGGDDPCMCHKCGHDNSENLEEK